MDSLGQRLRQLRTTKGLSLDDLAARAGVTKAYLWKLERKPDANPSLEIVQKIAAALGKSVADILPPPGGAAIVPLEIADSLREAQKRFGMTDEDVAALASIRFRGRQPAHIDDWGVLFLHLKNSVERGNPKK